jgi:glycosyltransferase involved in cell wall biosynthesis
MPAERTVLLVSDTGLEGTRGRAERFSARRAYLADHGWRLLVGHVREPYVLGFPRAVVGLARLARREGVDVVNSVNNPFHLHVVGYLVSLFAGAKWLAEFRDPLVENPDLDPDAPTMPLRRFVEWFAVHYADKVVWGNGIQISDEYFERTYPDVPAEQVRRLPFAGFDRDRFAAAEAATYEPFTITYAGSFYEGWIEPFGFLDGLARYADRHGLDGLRVQFYGDWTDEYEAAARAAGVAECIRTHDFVPHEQIVPVLKGSDLLLYIGGTDERNRLNVPSKLMDYIGAQRPTLAVVDPSFRAARVVEENGFGVAVSPTDPDAIASAIHDVRTGAFEYDVDPDRLASFERRNKNEQLVRVLDGLVPVEERLSRTERTTGG